MAAGNLVQGALFTVMVVRAGMLRDPAFAQQLATQVERSPRFFQIAPVVLDLKGADGFSDPAEFAEAREILGGHTLALVGVQNAEPAQLAAAAAAGLASFAPSVTTPARPRPAASAARGGDLIVTSAVSPGAELVADGNIHVYGPLRGRALAGASGDAGARIFCSRLEAELVSIAGRYLVSEQLPAEQHGFSVQIALVNDQLTITRI